MRIKNWPIAKLIDYARNPRKNDEVINKMIASIKEFGFRVPLLIRSDGLIIDGHLRKKAAVALGMTELPCVVADDLTETQIKAFRLVANQSANWASWDTELLRLELEDLKLENFDLDVLGFEDHYLAQFSDHLDNDTDDKEDNDKEKKYLLELEFPDEQSQKDCYEELCSRGLIVRFKNG